jgi:hypothetical protein
MIWDRMASLSGTFSMMVLLYNHIKGMEREYPVYPISSHRRFATG